MASAASILFEINSTNYNTGIFTIYKPQSGCSGFVTTLRLTIDIKSIAEANFPYIPDDTPPNVLQEILDQVALNTPYKEVVLFYKKGDGTWIQRAPIRIFNKEPFYDVNLMRFFSDANTIDVAEDFSLGIQLRLGNVLASTDKIAVWGSAVEEKKNNGNEELAAGIEALQLALSGKITDLPANILLGRNTGSGIVQQIPQSQFAKSADIDTAIFNLIGGAPGALNTLDELAQALADDQNFASTMTNLLATKVSLSGNETVTGNKVFSGFTSLGGIGIKISVLNFTSPNVSANTPLLAGQLPPMDKITGLTAWLRSSDTDYFPPSFYSAAKLWANWYSIYSWSSNLYINLHPDAIAKMGNQSGSVMITYKS